MTTINWLVCTVDQVDIDALKLVKAVRKLPSAFIRFENTHPSMMTVKLYWLGCAGLLGII